MPEWAPVVECSTCRDSYDPNDPVAVKRHTEPVGCGCGRCDGRPRCYSCGSSFCVCMSH